MCIDENKIKSLKSLEDLFSLWQKEHELEEEESCNNTICDAIIDREGNNIYIPKNSFIADGYINEDKNTYLHFEDNKSRSKE